MCRPIIADSRQVDLVEPMLLDASGEVDQSERIFDDIGLIARFLPENGTVGGLDRSFRIFDAQSAAVATVQLQ